LVRSFHLEQRAWQKAAQKRMGQARASFQDHGLRQRGASC
jgi:hypothetical protein